MKVMLTGTDSLWGLWLSFFRENFAALVSLVILLPLSLFLNWRLATLLDRPLRDLCCPATSYVLHRTSELQTSVEKYYSDLAERASDALGNVALVQSFARVEAEVMGLRMVVERLLRRADAGAVLVGGHDGPDPRLDHASPCCRSSCSAHGCSSRALPPSVRS